jgi:hypothetical protein
MLKDNIISPLAHKRAGHKTQRVPKGTRWGQKE